MRKKKNKVVSGRGRHHIDKSKPRSVLTEAPSQAQILGLENNEMEMEKVGRNEKQIDCILRIRE